MLKIVLIVPDLPEYMGGVETGLLKFIRMKNQNYLYKLYHEIDAYILLSKYMIERLPMENKPWSVVEGIFNNFVDDVNVNINDFALEIKTIFYSGTLARRYGIMNLVKAFTMLSDTNFRLVICGDGDALQEILSYAEKDNRILYKGQLCRIEVIRLQRMANLLINPRTPEGEFTKYSFPSKTMEYLASGVPTLLYKLPGIPEEYYQYCFSLDDFSITALSCKILEILQMDSIELKNIGIKARNFILTKKNPIEQAKKVMNVINSLNQK